jgi:hypothetical protein
MRVRALLTLILLTFKNFHDEGRNGAVLTHCVVVTDDPQHNQSLGPRDL